jgi:hypothetical protein
VACGVHLFDLPCCDAELTAAIISCSGIAT